MNGGTRLGDQTTHRACNCNICISFPPIFGLENVCSITCNYHLRTGGNLQILPLAEEEGFCSRRMTSFTSETPMEDMACRVDSSAAEEPFVAAMSCSVTVQKGSNATCNHSFTRNALRIALQDPHEKSSSYDRVLCRQPASRAHCTQSAGRPPLPLQSTFHLDSRPMCSGHRNTTSSRNAAPFGYS